MDSLRNRRVAELINLQKLTFERPYSIVHRLVIADAYKNLGYPDLAAGDAYKALLLVDEVSEETEYHEEALEAAREDFMSNSEHESASVTEELMVSWVRTECLEKAYVIDSKTRNKS